MLEIEAESAKLKEELRKKLEEEEAAEAAKRAARAAEKASRPKKKSIFSWGASSPEVPKQRSK